MFVKAIESSTVQFATMNGKEKWKQYRKNINLELDMCKTCKKRCCYQSTPHSYMFLDKQDYALWNNSVPEVPINISSDECMFCFDNGCSLPRNLRPTICIQYYCHKQPSLKDMENIKRKNKAVHPRQKVETVGDCMSWCDYPDKCHECDIASTCNTKEAYDEIPRYILERQKEDFRDALSPKDIISFEE